MAKAKSRGKKKKSEHSPDDDLIVIDEKAGLIFESEDALSAYFDPAIAELENEYLGLRSNNDYSDEEQIALEEHLEQTLDEPDEIWRDDKITPDIPVHIFIKHLEGYFYVALCYLSTDDDEPTFVMSHFPTRDINLAMYYQRHDLIYDREIESVQPAAVDGDALQEGDLLAMGLYRAMKTVRSEKDIPESEFQRFGELREETIENADEIWRKTDLDGNVLVCFIKEFPDQETKDLYYVAVTTEDEQSAVHSLLFSFPTNDVTLVDRYRQGENLQAEEIVQESSH